MPYYDNPAGRLHDFLIRLAEQPQGNSVLDGWAGVFGSEQGEVVVRLGPVADLVRQTQEAAERAGEDAMLPIVERYRDDWARPIFPHERPFTDPLSKVLPRSAALEALHLVSAQLHSIAPEGIVPGETELKEVKAQMRSLIDVVHASEDVPDEIKHLLISRLRTVEEAIEHLAVGGPLAVRRAMEAVMGSLVFTHEPGLGKSQTIRTVWTTLLVVWTVFSAGPTIQNSIDAWREMTLSLAARTNESSVESTAVAPSDGDGRIEDRPSSH
jgi:hypothetical protein